MTDIVDKTYRLP